MEKEFVPMDLALRMKAIGFDEPCFGWYSNNTVALSLHNVFIGKPSSGSYKLLAYAPTYSQCFRWFRNKHEIDVFYWRNDLTDKYRVSEIKISNKEINLEEKFEDIEYKTYGEAELACLIKLIEIIESKTE